MDTAAAHPDGFRDFPEHLESSPQNSSLQKKELGTSVYRQCWEEFYNWEPNGCQRLIAELSPNLPDSVSPDSFDGVLAFYGLSRDHDMTLDGDVDSRPFCSVWTNSIRGSYCIARLPFEEVEVAAFMPYPTYESCPPSSKCIASRIDEHTECEESPFIPYADEEDFDAVDYQRDCAWLSWQVDWRDPDLEVIKLETARRLHFEHGLSFADIDQLGFLGTLRFSCQSGLLWDTFQRDVLRWPGVLSQLPEFVTTFEGDQRSENITHAALKTDLQARVNSLLKSFCPNLNCVQAACPTHSVPFTSFDAVKPTKTSEELLEPNGTPCSEECFRHNGKNFLENIDWKNSIDEITLATVLDITPDLLPCDLAILCHKPCREVYAQRIKLHPDKLIVDSRALEAPRKSRASRATFRDQEESGHLNFTPAPPCHHKGPCDAQTKCSCFMQELHCQRSCRCSWDCKIRWKGCQCKLKSRVKQCTEKCKCLKAGRECDVDVCLCGSGRLGKSKTNCHNVKIQQGAPKAITIKRGKFGLGAFANATIAPNDYLGEYVGRVFHIDHPPHRLTASHRGLNYNFTLNSNLVIDAVACGNNTRYVNHGGSTANCEARIYFVNGEHRIGFFAIKKISAGQELLFDYGPDYWQDHAPG